MIPAGRIYFIGATAINKLSVVIVGSTIINKDSTFLTPPSPTASPPEQPTTSKTTQINPKRLNSGFSEKTCSPEADPFNSRFIII